MASKEVSVRKEPCLKAVTIRNGTSKIIHTIKRDGIFEVGSFDTDVISHRIKLEDLHVTDASGNEIIAPEKSSNKKAETVISIHLEYGIQQDKIGNREFLQPSNITFSWSEYMNDITQYSHKAALEESGILEELNKINKSLSSENEDITSSIISRIKLTSQMRIDTNTLHVATIEPNKQPQRIFYFKQLGDETGLNSVSIDYAIDEMSGTEVMIIMPEGIHMKEDDVHADSWKLANSQLSNIIELYCIERNMKILCYNQMLKSMLPEELLVSEDRKPPTGEKGALDIRRAC